jgi:methionyl-tRNA synthetase
VKRYLITSALPYINGIKHLGNLASSKLPADVYARYLRQRSHDVLYIWATDEHGTPADLAAKEAGLSVEGFCAQQHELQARIYAGFDLSFNCFGRSSSPQNRELTQRFGNRLADQGLIEERVVKQLYSRQEGRFLPDRYVIGTCPTVDTRQDVAISVRTAPACSTPRS